MVEEKTGTVSFSRRFMQNRLGLGLSLKYLQHGYTVSDAAKSDPIFSQGTSKTASTVDLGGTYSLHRNVRLGLAVRNATEPNVGLAGEDKLPRVIQAGVGLGAPQYRLALDVTSKSQTTAKEPGLGYSLGGEYRLGHSPLVLRAGLNNQEMTAGLGFTLNNLRLDYSMLLNQDLNQGTSGSHRVGLAWSWGQENRPKMRRAAGVPATNSRPRSR
jgi:hypothetical protein